VIPYVPKKGDFITADFDPQSGHEQKGRRPAIVISNNLISEYTDMVIVCPITGTDREYPFHVTIKNNPDVHGFVMVDQVKSIDYKTRKVKYIGKASLDILEEVLAVLDSCIY
jgi:mRNA interferase MazF